ncbi:SDR family NAD(P)-dependent oxidoreductase [Aquimarina aquimarini]|uniref:SDR family NAD(P)-dependent oxidoreductase n=1 Tax=Aquimarina aquimarini TaxID=1191734 RepID=UPI000D54CA52|nr:SDR family oxidoreductase [Aquimarina aquimarini]
MNQLINLNKKLAVVTGGTRGIGKAISLALLEAGARVIITGTTQKKEETIKQEFDSENIEYYQSDFGDEKSLQGFLEYLRSLKKIDILVNNAGINKLNLVSDISLSEYNDVLDINLKAPFLITQEVSQLMINNKGGKIVNITSIWSSVSRKERAMYSMSKWGLAGFSKSTAIDLAEHNILVNSVAPGFTLTELTEQTNTKEELRILEDKIPMRRLADPKEIANLVLFLSSELNTYLTGQNIIIDGGYTSL